MLNGSGVFGGEYAVSAEMKITISPIGFVKSRYKIVSRKVNIKPKRSRIVLFPQYAEGIYRIEEAEYLEVIFYFHRSEGYRLICETPHWGTKGVFASRSPFRPVSIGLTKVKLISVKENELVVEGLDAVDGTPVLDIKPYVDWSKLKKETTDNGKQKKSEKKDKGSIG